MKTEPNPPKDGAPATTRLVLEASVEALREFMATTEAALREGHKISVEHTERTARSIAWISGLMGGAIFGVQALLSHVPPSVRLTPLVAWASGIVLSVLARILSEELRARDDEHHFRKVSVLAVLRTVSNDRDLIARELRAVIESDRPESKEGRRLGRLLSITNAVYYLTHILFAVGLVAVATIVVVAGR